jgi:hypothetical protein
MKTAIRQEQGIMAQITATSFDGPHAVRPWIPMVPSTATRASDLNQTCWGHVGQAVCSSDPGCLWLPSLNQCQEKQVAYIERSLGHAMTTPIGWALMFWAVRNDVCRAAAQSAACGLRLPVPRQDMYESSRTVFWSPVGVSSVEEETESFGPGGDLTH